MLTMKNGTTLAGKNNRVKWCYLLLIPMLAYLFYRIPYGIGIVDESFLYTLVQRLLRGDRLMVDEWHVAQLLSIPLTVPYLLYVKIFGSTEGLLTGIRYFFAVFQVGFGVYLWRRLRRFGDAVFFFFIIPVCVFGPYLTFTYYNMAIDAALVVCLELLLPQKTPGKIKLVLLGIVCAFCVMIEPVLALLYFLYTFQVFRARWGKKKTEKPALFPGKRQLTPRVWACLTVGIVLVAAPFFLFLLRSYGWRLTPLLRTIPDLFTDSEYDFSLFSEHSHFLYLLGKIGMAVFYCGFVNTALAVTLLVYAVRYRKRGGSARRKQLLFLGALAVFCLACLHFALLAFFPGNTEHIRYVYNLPIRGYSIPVMVIGLIFLLLCDDLPPWYFGFWQTGVFISLFVDFSSEVSLGFGGILTLLPAVMLFLRLTKETYAPWREALLAAHPEVYEGKKGRALLRLLKAEYAALPKNKKKAAKKAAGKKKAAAKKKEAAKKGTGGAKPPLKTLPSRLLRRLRETALYRLLLTDAGRMAALKLLVAATAVTSVFWISVNYVFRTSVPRCERFSQSESMHMPLDAKIGRGPLKGAVTTADIKNKYTATLNDMDTINEKGDGPLYVDFLCPIPYVYRNGPMGVYSAWYVEEDTPWRMARYWQQHPERIPAFIYIPYYSSADYLMVNDEWLRQKIERMEQFFDLDWERGEGGYILYVHAVRSLEEP